MVDSTLAPLPFREAIDFFAAKTKLPTNTWTDIWQEQHTKAFVVAGAQKAALLTDFQNALAKALEQGTTLETFRRDFDDIVQRHGWTYKGKRGWRTRVIYETNLRTSFAAGRWDQIEKTKKLRPYLRYVTVGDERVRPRHRQWHGLVYAVDHEFWNQHYPPNGWGCRCTVQSLSERDLRKRGLTPSTLTPPGTQSHTITRGGRDTRVTVPAGIDPGFAYNPGRNRLSGLTPPPTPGAPAAGNGPAATAPLPAPRSFDATRLLPDDLSDEDYARAFLREFDADIGKPAVHIDPTGEALPITEELFRDARGKFKVRKAGRNRFLRLLAQGIKDPDEIWLDWERLEDGRYQLRRRYIARFTVDGGQRSGLTVFEITRRGWREVTSFSPNPRRGAVSQNRQLEKQRRGLLVYRRGEDG